MKKGLLFWGPIGLITGLLGWGAYKLFTKPSAGGKTEKALKTVKINSVYVNVISRGLLQSDDSSWRINWQNVSKDIIKNLSITVLNAKDGTSVTEVRTNANPGQEYALTIPAPPMVMTKIHDDSFGSILIKNTDTGQLLAQQDWKLTPAIYAQAKANYTQPGLI